MCLFFLALQPTSEYVLVAANNRDEYFDRETTRAAIWDDYPSILAGRDKVGRGTWLGVSTDGKLACLTNIRQHYNTPQKPTGVKSRGTLVTEFLQSECKQSPLEYSQSVVSQSQLYSGFNLITARLYPLERIELGYCTNGEPTEALRLDPGIYGLSNERLDSPWHKVTRGKSRFSELVSGLQNGILTEVECEKQLMELLCDDTCLFPDDNVPTLGFPEITLRQLNSLFVSPIQMPIGFYGTRTNTVVMVKANGSVTYTERTRKFPVDISNPSWETVKFELSFSPQH